MSPHGRVRRETEFRDIRQTRQDVLNSAVDSKFPGPALASGASEMTMTELRHAA